MSLGTSCLPFQVGFLIDHLCELALMFAYCFFFFCRAGTRDDGGRDAMQRRHSSNTEGMPAERWAQCVSQAAR